MDILSTLILAFVQGITEFLPVSSSGHLVLASYLLGFLEMDLGFSVALHVGTLIAVIVYFWRDWVEIFRLAFLKRVGSIYDMQTYAYTKRTLYYLGIATVPAVVVGLLLGSFIERAITHPMIVALLIFASGLVLWLVDLMSRHSRNVQSIRTRDALIIGCAQVLALVPGVSRSGMTMTAALYLGLKRREAARFSFLMATPVILGAAMLKMPALFQVGMAEDMLLGIIISFISAFVAIKYMLAFIERVRYQVFFWYSLGLSFFIFAVMFAS